MQKETSKKKDRVFDSGESPPPPSSLLPVARCQVSPHIVSTHRPPPLARHTHCPTVFCLESIPCPCPLVSQAAHVCQPATGQLRLVYDNRRQSELALDFNLLPLLQFYNSPALGGGKLFTSGTCGSCGVAESSTSCSTRERRT